MTDDQVEQFLVKHGQRKGMDIWSHLKGTPELEVMRSPYFLRLLVEQVEGAGGIPKGQREAEAERQEHGRQHALVGVVVRDEQEGLGEDDRQDHRHRDARPGAR